MFSYRPAPPRYRRIRPNHRPRGIAVVMVLGLLAITLAISYATLRGQGTTSQLSRNNSRAFDARAASQSGLAAAIRKISENGWTGIGVGLSANVTNQSWYEVTYSTGDERLLSAPPDEKKEYPFRVTIQSVGYAADPLNPAVRSEHKSRCIVQLVRKQLVTEPANWPAVRACTVLQYADQNALVQFPVRMSGPICLLGKLIFCTDYPNHVLSRDQYLTDLNARRIAGLGDDRPFPTNIVLRGLTTVQDTATVTLLTSKLGVTPIDTTVSPGAPVNHPGTLFKYRLYPGGREYDIPLLHIVHGNPLQNVTIVPDPQENPLGIYRSSGGLTISHNVNFTGTIVTDPGVEVHIGGTGVNLKALELPELSGSSDKYQLPVALFADDLKINSGADANIEGMTLVWDKFELKSGLSTTKFAVKGNLITDRLEIRGRTNWTQNPFTWGLDRSQFLTQLANVLDPNRSLYFPDYMERQKTFVAKPALTFTPNSSGVKPHWHDWSQPIYQPDPLDPGLRWEIIRWEDNL